MPSRGSIFISYRRDGSISETGRIYDRLVTAFGKEHVFKDVDSIPLGIDLAEYIAREVGKHLGCTCHHLRHPLVIAIATNDQIFN